jgi:hypothetical protein
MAAGTTGGAVPAAAADILLVPVLYYGRPYACYSDVRLQTWKLGAFQAGQSGLQDHTQLE